MIEESETIEFTGKKFIQPMNLTEVEKAYAMSLEFDNQVASYFPAQMAIQAKPEPDEVFLKINFWVVYENRLERLIHIHDEKFNMTLWDGALNNTSDLTACFTPIPVEKVMREPRKSNLELLWKFAEVELEMGYLGLLHQFFMETRNPTISSLRKYLAENELDPNLVYSFIFHKALICRLDGFPLRAGSVILLNPCLDPDDKWKYNMDHQMSFF